jgi:chromate transporter
MRPSLRDLFVAFMTISVSAFGGALPWARYVMVKKRAWLTAEEFTEMLTFCQFLPGPNIVNIAITVGARFQGPLGAMAALLGLILPAFCTVIALGALYARYGSLHMLRGCSPA